MFLFSPGRSYALNFVSKIISCSSIYTSYLHDIFFSTSARTFVINYCLGLCYQFILFWSVYRMFSVDQRITPFPLYIFNINKFRSLTRKTSQNRHRGSNFTSDPLHNDKCFPIYDTYKLYHFETDTMTPMKHICYVIWSFLIYSWCTFY